MSRSPRPLAGRMHGVAAVVTVAAVLMVATPAGSADHREDLSQYYPNVAMVESGRYLEGFNWVSGEPQRSVLWFELQRGGLFRQHNWAPDDARAGCHWDQFRWRRGVLRYDTTHDSCGAVTHETQYSPGLPLMPQFWESGAGWNRSGSSTVTHSENGVVVCRGITAWEAAVLGWVDIAPGVPAIHVRSRQTTRWTEGHGDTGCSAGFVTRWQEDYFLMPELPVDGGGTAPAFKRSVGGNLDGGADRWDVWFDRWALLPS